MSQNEKEKLKQLIRKNKYLAYILLGILGGVLIAYAWVAAPNWKDIPMGIGTGIVATVIGFIMIIPGASEPSVRTLRATIPENESQPNFLILV